MNVMAESAVTGVGALKGALERVPGGTEAVRLMAKLGLWTNDAHRAPAERKPFPTKFSQLGPNELSDLSARVISEAGRVMELSGILTGLEAQLKIKARAVRAAARSNARRNWPEDSKAPTKTELDDLAEEDPAVVEVDEQLALLGLLLAQVNAVREANSLYKEGVSREITYRAAQLNARMY